MRNVPERHRSIRAVFDYSWQRLDESERRIFSQFAIFRGGFTRVAAQKVTGATIRTLATFVSKSLLQYNQTTDRYQVHELLRQYGAEKLAADPDGEVAVRGRHSAYYCAELQRREAVFRSGRTQKAIAEIDLNIANIRTAWNWAITQGDVVRIDQALDGLCGFYDWSGHLQDGIAVCRAAIDRLIALDPASPLVTKRVNAQGLIQRVLSRAFANQAEFNSRLGFLDLAAPLLEQSVALVEDLTAAGLDARREKAIALAIQGTLAYQSDNPETARQHLKDSLSLSRAIGDHWSVLNTLNQLGFIARAVGNYHKAKQWYEEALSLARGQQNQWGEVNALLGLGWVARNMVAYDEARRLFEQSLVLSQSQGDKRSTAHAVEYLGYLALFQGCFEEASQRLQQSISLSLEIGFRPGLVFTLSNLGVTQWLNGAFEGAYQSIQESLATARELEQPHLLIWPTICHAELHACAGRYAEAHEQAQLAYAWAQQMYATPFVNGRIHRVLGWIALAAEKHEEACAQFQKSVDLYRVIVDDEQTAWSLAGAGCAAIGLGNLDEAQEYLTDALWTAIEIRAFIPLLFAVPVVALLLSVRGETERAFRVYRQACRFPLVANSGLFADLVGRHLPDIIDSPPAEDASQETDHRGALWATGAQLLAKWFQQWII
ncbi:MAG: tetratricopeptide repeat protein [Anaerolineales bacterium]